jgi:N-acetyl-anhydromuramyl-L-alanine amidase AmpD
MMLKTHDSGKRVKALQETILRVNKSALSRFGADGDLGGETLAALSELLKEPKIKDTGLIDHQDQQRLLDLVPSSVPFPKGHVDNRKIVDAKERQHLRTPNAVYDVVWHQADVEMGEKARRFVNSSAHFFVTSAGQIFQLHDIEWLTFHAHALNETTIGIEIEGMFAGVEGDTSNASWPQYHKVLGRKPQQLTEAQIEAAKELARYLKAYITSRGGSLRNYYAHRQGSNTRDRDPGQLIWKKIVQPSALETGCVMPIGEVFGKGKTIPKEWL